MKCVTCHAIATLTPELASVTGLVLGCLLQQRLTKLGIDTNAPGEARKVALDLLCDEHLSMLVGASETLRQAMGAPPTKSRS